MSRPSVRPWPLIAAAASDSWPVSECATGRGRIEASGPSWDRMRSGPAMTAATAMMPTRSGTIDRMAQKATPAAIRPRLSSLASRRTRWRTTIQSRAVKPSPGPATARRMAPVLRSCRTNIANRICR